MEASEPVTTSKRTSWILNLGLGLVMLWTSPLRAEKPAVDPQVKEPVQNVQDRKTQEPKNLPSSSQESKQEAKDKKLRPEEAADNSVRSLILTVKLALLADERTASTRINVETEGEQVTLSGKVSSEAEKLAVADVASHVEGVKSLINRLEVDKELQKTLPSKRDQIITEYVKERFTKSATLQAANFDIQTRHGVVELTGKTRFQVIVLEAAQAAMQIPGVKAVKTDKVRIEGGE